MTANDSTPPTTVLGQHSPLARKHSLTLVVGFALIVLIGAILLRLPIAGSHRTLT
ncbi:MAG TPA: ATPase, partial [Caldilineae bacterium]|nr:ATPase [Caldilineae bacterium]